MTKHKREDYASHLEWLEEVKQDRLWRTQLERLQSKDSDTKQLHDDALEMIGRERTYHCWNIYSHNIELTIEEVWEAGELSLPTLKFQTIGMLTIEWLEEHGQSEDKGKKKRELPKELQKNGVKANLDKLKSMGLLDDNYQPVKGKVQLNQLAAIANKIGDSYGIDDRWSAFGKLWGKKSENLRSSFAQFNPNTDKHKEFEEKVLKQIR